MSQFSPLVFVAYLEDMEETLLRAVLNKYAKDNFSIHLPRLGETQVVLPIFTIRQQPVHVYIRTHDNGSYILSDQRDLQVDSYEVSDSGSDYPYLKAFGLLSSGYYPAITTAPNGSFIQTVGHVDNLAAAIFAFAQFIAMVINLAHLQKEKDAQIIPHTW